MMSPSVADLLDTEVVRVLGPVTVKESKSRRSCNWKHFEGEYCWPSSIIIYIAPDQLTWQMLSPQGQMLTYVQKKSGETEG